MISTEKKLMVLLKIAKVLNKQNFVWAIGASCMLYLNNITNDFHDIDIMISIDQATQAKE